jgi:hypothetical protein
MGVLKQTFWVVNTTSERIKLVHPAFMQVFKSTFLFVDPGKPVALPNAAWTGGMFRDKRLKLITEEEAEALLTPADEPVAVVDEPETQEEVPADEPEKRSRRKKE